MKHAGFLLLLAFLAGLAIGLWTMFLLDYAIVSQCDELARNVELIFPAPRTTL